MIVLVSKNTNILTYLLTYFSISDQASSVAVTHTLISQPQRVTSTSSLAVFKACLLFIVLP